MIGHGPRDDDSLFADLDPRQDRVVDRIIIVAQLGLILIGATAVAAIAGLTGLLHGQAR